MLVVLCLLILCFIGKAQEAIPGSEYLQIVKLLLAASILAQLFLSEPLVDGFRLNRAPFQWWLAFVATIFLSLPTSLHVGGSLSFLLWRYTPTALLAYLFARNVSSMAMAEWTSAMTLPMVWFIGAGIALWPSIVVDFDGRERYTIGHSYDCNDLSLIVLMCVPFLLYWFWRGGMMTKAVVLLTGLIILFILSRTSSRSALLLVGITMVYVVFFVPTMPLWIRGALMAALLLGGAGATQTKTFQALILGLQGEDYNSDSYTGRWHVWSRGITYMIRRPVTGVGADMFPIAEGNSEWSGLDRNRIGSGIKWSAAHNSYIQVGAELGITGLICWLMIWISSWREFGRQDRLLAEWDWDPEARRVRTFSNMCRTCLLTYLLGGMFLSQGYSSFAHLLLGYVIAVGNITDRLVLELEEEEAWWAEHQAAEAAATETATTIAAEPAAESGTFDHRGHADAAAPAPKPGVRPRA